MVKLNSTVSRQAASKASAALTSSAANNFLDIDAIRANPLYTCYITLPTGLQITGIVDSGNTFEVSTGAKYEDTASMPSFADALNEVAGLAANLSGQTQFIAQSIRMTEARWTGCENPSFNLKLEIPIIREADDPWKYLDYILMCTTPRTSNDAGVVTGGGSKLQQTANELLIYAPNGYRINYDKSGHENDSPQGTVSIKIGNWFEAHNMLITDAQVSISGKKLYTGDPISISIQFTFRYWKLPTYADMRSWFTRMKLIST